MTLMDQKIVIECVLKMFFLRLNSVSRFYRFSDGNSYEDLRGWDDGWYSRAYQKYEDEEEHNQFIV